MGFLISFVLNYFIMCKYCEDEEVLLDKEEVISSMSWGWGNPEIKINRDEASKSEYTLSVFVDRGYLRLVDLEESGCLDHGQKIQINYCPHCGTKLN